MKGTIMRSVVCFFLACSFVPLVAASGSATEIQIVPTVQGSARDSGPQDGIFDFFLAPPNDTQLFNNGFQQSRVAFEFDISAIPSGSQINSADLQICISVPNDPGARQIELHGYAGNGTLELADYAEDNLIDSRTLLPGEGSPSVSFDFSSFLGSELANAETFVGFNLREEPPPPTNPIIMRAPCSVPNTLVINVDFSSAPTTLKVPIDIKPGSDPNSINLCSKGVITVAILSTFDPAFDATQVLGSSIEFAGQGIPLKKKGTLWASEEDVNNDGLDDYVFHIEVENLSGLAGETEATLTGELADGTPIEGTDAVTIVRDDCPN